jgi:hypothetical protein
MVNRIIRSIFNMQVFIGRNELKCICHPYQGHQYISQLGKICYGLIKFMLKIYKVIFKISEIIFNQL